MDQIKDLEIFRGLIKKIQDGHESKKTITKEDALRKLAFASMLMYKLDEVK